MLLSSPRRVRRLPARRALLVAAVATAAAAAVGLLAPTSAGAPAVRGFRLAWHVRIRAGASARAVIVIPARVDRLTVRSRAGRCARGLSLVVQIDGAPMLKRNLSRMPWKSMTRAIALGPGAHRIRATVSSARRCRGAALVDSVAFRPAAGASTSKDPFAGQRWWVDPSSAAARTEASWRAQGRTYDADQLHKISMAAVAGWFGSWSGEITSAVASYSSRAAARSATQMVLVSYRPDLLDRCDQSSATAYAAWIRAFGAGIGTNDAAVILEPDAVASLDGECQSDADRRRELQTLADAVSVLSSRASVYIDAGNAGWIDPTTMGSRLRSAGLARARGIALNVSNFDLTSNEIAYARQVLASAGIPGRHVVIDTSRNGRGRAPDGSWCNPPGRGLGSRPTANAGDPLVDALFWIKPPGESDGDGSGCNQFGAAPPAGSWWPAYALMLAERSAG